MEASLELIVHADADHAATFTALARHVRPAGEPACDVVDGLDVVALVEVDVETFDLGRPVVGEGVLDAAAERPAGVRVSLPTHRWRQTSP